MWDLKPFNIYTLYSQEKKSYFFNVGFEAITYIYSMITRKKSYIFLMWDKKLFGLNTSI